MPKSVFVVGIGGTGMRCIESFVHLCAIGMFDDTEVHLLAMDTDKDNGNFRRLATLVDNYKKINGGHSKSETLFSAKINYYQFSPDYDKTDNATMARIINNNADNNIEIANSVSGTRVKATDLADLLIRPEVKEMSLAHGYRAQTQMGSMLMYYAILEEAYNTRSNSGGLRDFLSNLNNGSAGKQVFVFGSVFGGTGASSLPIIPPAFNEAAKIMFNNDSIDLVKNNYYGAVILTNYFTFDIQCNEKVYATADKFALNSQAALNFYNNDQTVKDVYKRLYVLGRDAGSLRRLPSGGTGGADQCNPSDFIELMAAFAAHDFFKQCDKPNSFDNPDKRFVCRGLDDNISHLSFRNFTEDDKEFMKRLGVMTVTSFIDSAYEYFENLRRDTVHFDENDLIPLKKYFQMFGIKSYTDEKGRLVKGWLNQIVESAKDCGYQEGAFFKPTLFACSSDKDFKKYEINEKVFNMESAPTFKVKLFSNPFNVIKDKVIDTKPENNKTLEQLMERTYLALSSLYSL